MTDIAYKAVRLDKTSHYDEKTKWRIGKVVAVYNPDPASKGPCGRGIHTSPTILSAVSYQQGPSIYALCRVIDPISFDTDKTRSRAVMPLRWLKREEVDELAGFKLWEANHAVNPLALLPKRLAKRHHDALAQWASVWDSVRDSVSLSVGSSVGSSVWGSVRDSVQGSVRGSVWTSVRDSVWTSVRGSVWDSVWGSLWASVWASVRGYTGGLFPEITAWKQAEHLGPDPWRLLLTLWYDGYVPSFDGKVWRLHCGKDARVAWEWKP